MPPKSKRQRVETSSGPVTYFHINQAVKYLKDDFLHRKNAGAISLDQLVRGVMKERKVDIQVLDKLKMELSEHPSVKVTQGDGDPPDNWYTFRPIYAIQSSKDLVLKLQNSGGLLLDHVESSLPSAEIILPKLLNKKILKVTGKNPNFLVLHHNPQDGVSKIELDVNTKNLWQHPPNPREHGDDVDQKILAYLMKGNLSYLPHEIKPSQVSENLKELATLVVSTFNTPQEAIVLERVIHFDCLYRNSLDTLCHFRDQSKTNPNELAISLEKLISDRLLQAHSLEDEEFYFVNYQKLYNIVSYKMDVIRKECGADQKEKMQPIFKLLQEPDDLKVVPHILNPRPANPQRFRRDTTGYLKVTSEE